jgi:arabinofuranosyltransferase
VTAPSTEADRGVSRRWVFVAICAAVVVLYALLAWHRRWMADDGFVNLRVVDQIKAGHGPVFNRGERVEAVTSPLWVYLLTVADVVAPLRSEWVAVLLGLACAIGGFALVMFGAARLTRRADAGGGVDRWPLPLGALVLVAVSPVWDFASAGLEIGLVFLWLAGCLFAFASWARANRRASLWLAALLGLGPLIRPDLLVFSLVFLVALLVGEKARGHVRWVALLAAWVAIPAAYQVFRMGYYGALVPNTAFAKAADQSSYAAGWHYLTNLVGTYWLWVPLLIVVAVAVWFLRAALAAHDRRVFVVAVAFPVAALLHAAYIVRVGGDYMHGRLLLPALFAFAAPFAVVWLPRTRPMLAAVGAVAVWALVAGIALRAPTAKFPALVWDDRRLISEQTNGAHPVLASERFGAATLRRLEPRLYVGLTPANVGESDVQVRRDVPLPAILTYAIGATGYLVGPDVHVIDRLGLGDVFTAHLQLEHRGIPGHEKTLPAHYAIARLVRAGTPYDPNLFAVSPLAEWRRGETLDELRADLHRRDEAVPLAERVAVARQVLQCRDVVRLLGTARAPLTPSRFLHNLVDSVRTYRTEIPWEPQDAKRRLC